MYRTALLTLSLLAVQLAALAGLAHAQPSDLPRPVPAPWRSHHDIVLNANTANESANPTAATRRVWCSTAEPLDTICEFHWRMRPGGPLHTQRYAVTHYSDTPVGDGWLLHEVDFTTDGPEEVAS